MSQVTLYQRPGAWGLPSLSPADTQVQAYLQLAGVEHTTVGLATPAQSPTEQLPALEHGAELPGGDADAETPETEFEAARLLLRYLKDRVQDLDKNLSDSSRAEVLALTSLVERHLEAATIYTTWLEDAAFNKHTKVAYGEGLPFPMNRWVPWRTRKTAALHFKAHSAKQIYDSAGQAYADLAKQLKAHSSGVGVKFFFGEQASSFDAVLYPHLLYHYRAPVAAPELRRQLELHPILVQYIESVAHATRTTVPRRPPRARGGWERPATAQEDRNETASERRLKRSGQVWLAAAGAAIVLYVVLSGQFVSMEYGYEDDEDDDE